MMSPEPGIRHFHSFPISLTQSVSGLAAAASKAAWHPRLPWRWVTPWRYRWDLGWSDDRTIALPGVALCLPGHGMCFLQVEMRDIARWWSFAQLHVFPRFLCRPLAALAKYNILAESWSCEGKWNHPLYTWRVSFWLEPLRDVNMVHPGNDSLIGDLALEHSFIWLTEKWMPENLTSFSGSHPMLDLRFIAVIPVILMQRQTMAHAKLPQILQQFLWLHSDSARELIHQSEQPQSKQATCLSSVQGTFQSSCFTWMTDTLKPWLVRSWHFVIHNLLGDDWLMFLMTARTQVVFPCTIGVEKRPSLSQCSWSQRMGQFWNVFTEDPQDSYKECRLAKLQPPPAWSSYSLTIKPTPGYYPHPSPTTHAQIRSPKASWEFQSPDKCHESPSGYTSVFIIQLASSKCPFLLREPNQSVKVAASRLLLATRYNCHSFVVKPVALDRTLWALKPKASSGRCPSKAFCTARRMAWSLVTDWHHTWKHFVFWCLLMSFDVFWYLLMSFDVFWSFCDLYVQHTWCQKPKILSRQTPLNPPKRPPLLRSILFTLNFLLSPPWGPWGHEAMGGDPVDTLSSLSSVNTALGNCQSSGHVENNTEVDMPSTGKSCAKQTNPISQWRVLPWRFGCL